MNIIRFWLLSILLVCLGAGGLYGSDLAPGDEQHSIAGIGIVAGADTPGKGKQTLRDHLVVRQVLLRSPALKAGMVVGDEIVEIDGARLAGMSFADAVHNHLRGPLGSPVKLKVVRAGQSKPLDCVIVRDIVPTDTK